MTFLEILLIAVSLAMDAFAVSIGVGSQRHVKGLRPALRLSFHFGLFQFFMPVLGWFFGLRLERAMNFYDHWVAFGLLTLVGARMLRAGFHADPAKHAKDPTRGLSLLMLSVATSIDAFAVGISLAMLSVSIWYPSAVIGVVTAVISLSGIYFGTKLGERFGQKMEIVGGLILILIGLRIVIAHEFGV